MYLKEQVKIAIRELFSASERDDMVGIYACLTTDFQRRVPLNYFLINEKYKQYVGLLEDIGEIAVNEEGREVFADVSVNINGKSQIIGVTLKKDFGNWKIMPESIFDF
jgi:hypothetical protein